MVRVGNIISLNITTLHLNDIVYIHIDSCMCTHLHNTHIYNLNICLWLFKSFLAFLSNHHNSLSLCIPPLSLSVSLSFSPSLIVSQLYIFPIPSFIVPVHPCSSVLISREPSIPLYGSFFLSGLTCSTSVTHK